MGYLCIIAVMKKKNNSQIYLLIFGGIVTVLIIYLSTDFKMENTSLDFSKTISNKKLPKTPGYHTQPIIEFNNRTMVHLGDYTTNIIRNGKTTRFFKTKVSVRTSDEDVSEEIKRKNIVIRDAVIKALGSKHFEQVATQEGKLELKKEVAAAINERLTEGKVEEVFFTQFIVQ